MIAVAAPDASRQGPVATPRSPSTTAPRSPAGPALLHAQTGPGRTVRGHRTTINNVIRQTRPMLGLVAHAPEPTGIRFNSLTEPAGSQPRGVFPNPRRSKHHVNNLQALNVTCWHQTASVRPW